MSQSAPGTWCPALRDGVAFAFDGDRTDAGDRLVVWGPAVAVPVLLEPIDAAVLSLLDGVTSVDELIGDIVAVFAVAPPRAAEELDRMLGEWAWLGLIEPSPTSPPVGAATPVGPDPVAHPLTTPAVQPINAVGALVRRHATHRLAVRAGALDLTIAIEGADLHAEVAERLRPIRTDGDPRRRFALLRERLDGDDAPYLLLSDIGLPLHRGPDRETAVRAVTGHVSQVIDLAEAVGVSWFRLATIVDQDHRAILLSHELLHPFPELDSGLTARGWRLEPTQHAAIDLDSGVVVRHPDRFAGSALQEAQRAEPVGVVVLGGGPLGPAPATESEWRWFLSLLASIGHDPRRDDWADRWRGVQLLRRAPSLVVRDGAAATTLAAIDSLLAR